MFAHPHCHVTQRGRGRIKAACPLRNIKPGFSCFLQHHPETGWLLRIPLQGGLSTTRPGWCWLVSIYTTAGHGLAALGSPGPPRVRVVPGRSAGNGVAEITKGVQEEEPGGLFDDSHGAGILSSFERHRSSSRWVCMVCISIGRPLTQRVEWSTFLLPGVVAWEVPFFNSHPDVTWLA